MIATSCWQQQLEPRIKLHYFQYFVVNPSILLQFLNEADCEYGTISPAYRHGNTKIKCYWHGFNLYYRNLSFLMFLKVFSPIRFEMNFMSIFTNRHEQEFNNLVLNFIPHLLKMVQWRIFFEWKFWLSSCLCGKYCFSSRTHWCDS